MNMEILKIISRREKAHILLILTLAIAVAGLEIATASSLIPFLALLSDPNSIQSNIITDAIFSDLLEVDYSEQLLALGAISLGVLLIASITKLLSLFIQNRFFEMIRSDISVRLFGLYLQQPYTYYASSNTSEAARNVLSEVDIFVGRGLMPLTTATVSAITSVGLIGFMLYVDPLITASASLLFGLIYAALFFGLKEKLLRLGNDRKLANTDRFTIVDESFTAIKLLKVSGKEGVMIARFTQVAELIAKNLYISNFLAFFPKSVLEVIGFGGIIAVAVATAMSISVDTDIGASSPLPIIGTLAYALYRLLPSLQNTYQNLSSFSFAKGMITDIFRTFGALEAGKETLECRRTYGAPEGDLVLENVTYKHRLKAVNPLQNISFRLPPGKKLGICGPSGSGKSTLLDAIIGLVQPDSGKITIGEMELSDTNLASWRGCFGYVPQETVIINGTVLENIAFGSALTEHSSKFAMECAQVADLKNFVTSELPDGFDTVLGGTGVRLSGGQRQRIAIARALFRRPAFLVFDEATSALDAMTERKVLKSVCQTFSETSIIVATHRLESLREFDSIIVMKLGKAVSIGGFSQLYESSETFRELVVATP